MVQTLFPEGSSKYAKYIFTPPPSRTPGGSHNSGSRPPTFFPASYHSLTISSLDALKPIVAPLP